MNFVGRLNLNTWGWISQQKNGLRLYFLSLDPASGSLIPEGLGLASPRKILVDLRETECYIMGKCQHHSHF
jgi:hypothetical protein